MYLPKTGDRLPGVVVLHHAGLATRDANLYRHLREGLPAMGIAVLLYTVAGVVSLQGTWTKLTMRLSPTTQSPGSKRWASFHRSIRTRLDSGG